MKVNIDKTLEVSDEQRKQIAAVVDGPGAKKRDATRDEMKDFIWGHGSTWEHQLELQLNGEAETGADSKDVEPDAEPDADPDDDLIGGGDEVADEDLI